VHGSEEVLPKIIRILTIAKDTGTLDDLTKYGVTIDGQMSRARSL
jgi:hypothetical protein